MVATLRRCGAAGGVGKQQVVFMFCLRPVNSHLKGSDASPNDGNVTHDERQSEPAECPSS